MSILTPWVCASGVGPQRRGLLLGSDYVVMGTDWPIAEEKSVPERLHKAFAFCGLAASQQQMIASGNTLKLLGVS
jgi:hypothetical protein